MRQKFFVFPKAGGRRSCLTTLRGETVCGFVTREVVLSKRDVDGIMEVGSE